MLMVVLQDLTPNQTPKNILNNTWALPNHSQPPKQRLPILKQLWSGTGLLPRDIPALAVGAAFLQTTKQPNNFILQRPSPWAVHPEVPTHSCYLGPELESSRQAEPSQIAANRSGQVAEKSMRVTCSTLPWTCSYICGCEQ